MIPAHPHLLLNGATIPQLGLGVYTVPQQDAASTVVTAIEAGYRHVDTATLYANERAVGDGIRASGIRRDDLFLTTKVWRTTRGTNPPSPRPRPVAACSTWTTSTCT